MTYFFPDNTVLINFAHIGQLSLLATLLQGRGRWAAAVAAECENSAEFPGLHELRNVPEFMGEALYPDNAERIDARTIQSMLRFPGDAPDKSYGEAVTIAIIRRRGLEALFLTDDGGAITWLAANHPELKTFNTTQLLALAVRAGKLSMDDATIHISTLRRLRRTRMTDFEFRTLAQL